MYDVGILWCWVEFILLGDAQCMFWECEMLWIEYVGNARWCDVAVLCCLFGYCVIVVCCMG